MEVSTTHAYVTKEQLDQMSERLIALLESKLSTSSSQQQEHRLGPRPPTRDDQVNNPHREDQESTHPSRSEEVNLRFENPGKSSTPTVSSSTPSAVAYIVETEPREKINHTSDVQLILSLSEFEIRYYIHISNGTAWTPFFKRATTAEGIDFLNGYRDLNNWLKFKIDYVTRFASTQWDIVVRRHLFNNKPQSNEKITDFLRRQEQLCRAAFIDDDTEKYHYLQFSMHSIGIGRLISKIAPIRTFAQAIRKIQDDHLDTNYDRYADSKTKVCEYHPNANTHTTDQCRQNKKSSFPSNKDSKKQTF